MSGRYAFLRSGRWLGIAVLALAISLACVLLGRWQLSRYDFKAEQAELVSTNYDAAPVAVSELLPTPQTSLPHSQTWRPVQLHGEYLTPALTLPQRPIDGSAADHVIAVFAADVSGQTWLVVVDRGWYPTDSFTDHTAQGELPEGEVDLTVRLRAAEPASDRDLGPGRLHALHPEQVLDKWEEVSPEAGVDEAELVTGAYGTLASESPAVAEPPAPLPRPSTDLGNHLSYTFQWWVFGIGAWVGFVVLARREAEAQQLAESVTDHEPVEPDRPAGTADRRQAAGARPGQTAHSRRRMRLADDAEEDALIDAQLAAQRHHHHPAGDISVARAADRDHDVTHGRGHGDPQARDTSSR